MVMARKREKKEKEKEERVSQRRGGYGGKRGNARVTIRFFGLASQNAYCLRKIYGAKKL